MQKINYQLNNAFVDLLLGVNASSNIITIPKKSVYTIDIYPEKPSEKHFLADAYVKSTNWAGVVPQGQVIYFNQNRVSITVYNTLDVDVATPIEIVGIYCKIK